MAWTILFAAGLFEVGFTTCMKKSLGFSQPLWTILFLICAVLSFGLLAIATRSIPLSIAYAVWTGFGAVGTVLIGALVFREQLGALQYGFVALIVVGIVGVKATAPPPAPALGGPRPQASTDAAAPAPSRHDG
ncbi:MAG TPA: multidrug efflux SMR transporter [Phycisphaerales bacterium]|nr:multidrug efflux SMR transporter [Phycisphaerales bacterium]HMP37501.1 multidrug efflux SMR transporter [Phycisphaerales bacterium]